MNKNTPIKNNKRNLGTNGYTKKISDSNQSGSLFKKKIVIIFLKCSLKSNKIKITRSFELCLSKY